VQSRVVHIPDGALLEPSSQGLGRLLLAVDEKHFLQTPTNGRSIANQQILTRVRRKSRNGDDLCPYLVWFAEDLYLLLPLCEASPQSVRRLP